MRRIDVPLAGLVCTCRSAPMVLALACMILMPTWGTPGAVTGINPKPEILSSIISCSWFFPVESRILISLALVWPMTLLRDFYSMRKKMISLGPSW